MPRAQPPHTPAGHPQRDTVSPRHLIQKHDIAGLSCNTHANKHRYTNHDMVVSDLATRTTNSCTSSDTLAQSLGSTSPARMRRDQNIHQVAARPHLLRREVKERGQLDVGQAGTRVTQLVEELVRA